jgi:hypothetical protein
MSDTSSTKKRLAKSRQAATNATGVSPLERVREICQTLGATEKEAWGGPTFRAAHGMFAMYVDNHHGDGRLALWVRAQPGLQETVVRGDPKRFFVPPYVGHNGWIGVHLNRGLSWKKVAYFLIGGFQIASAKPVRKRARRDRPQPLAPYASPAANRTDAPRRITDAERGLLPWR